MPHLSNATDLPPGRLDVAGVRREQIVEAAIEIIASQGLPKLSLSKIEQRAGMTRGQLTYYFPTKESILLAVFDRMLHRMLEHIAAADGNRPGDTTFLPGMWEHVQKMFGRAWAVAPPAGPSCIRSSTRSSPRPPTGTTTAASWRRRSPSGGT